MRRRVDSLSEKARDALVADVSEELASAARWIVAQEHIDGDAAMAAQLSDALRRASRGDRDALGEIEALALAGRDAAAEQIVERFLRDHPHDPIPPARLLAKYPSGRIPQAELLHALQLAA